MIGPRREARSAARRAERQRVLALRALATVADTPGVLPRAPTAALRRYRPPVAGFVAIGGCILVVILAVALGVAERAAPIFMVIIAVSAVLTIWQALSAIRTGGLFETADGIENHRLLGVGCRRVPWGEIADFRAVRSRVFAVTLHGSAIALAGVAQGSRIRWNGGETRDIVGVLNQRLEAHRIPRAPEPPVAKSVSARGAAAPIA